MTYEEYATIAAEDGEMLVYAKATSHDWAKHLNVLPLHMRGGLVRWVLFGIKPGSFLRAVLRNNLMDALGQADAQNRHLLWEYGNFLHNGTPSNCFGSEETFNAWEGLAS